MDKNRLDQQLTTLIGDAQTLRNKLQRLTWGEIEHQISKLAERLRYMQEPE